MNARTQRTCTLAALAALLLSALCQPAAARSLQEQFKAANDAYFQGDFERAASHYLALVEAGVHDPDLYFNLATTEAHRGRLGHAILYFERSLWLEPGDGAAERGLEAARRILARRWAEAEGEATVRTRPPLSAALLRPLSADLLAWLLLVCNALFFGCLLVRSRLEAEAVRLGLTIAAPILALLTLLSGLGLLAKLDRFEAGQAAIVVAADAQLLEGPHGRAKGRGRAREGQPARTLSREGDFVRVRMAGGAAGWLPVADVHTIRPD
ncbi:MAG: hypothetical protein OEZ06_14395 [Myxococcales bacterium]|nr:hypothetical protein [Myxococcales bacterium]